MSRIDGSQRGALVSIESARRIARAVQAYEQGKRDDNIPRLKRAFDDGGDPVKIGKTTEKWAKGTTTELDLYYEDDCEDEGSSGSETLEAHNLSFDVDEGAKCIVALAGNGCWYLVEAEGSPIKIGRTTEKWAKGTTTELELYYEDDCEDEGSSGSETLEAHNFSYDVNEDVRCIVALAGNGCWYLVEAESCPDDGSGSDEGSGSECGCAAIGGQDLTTLDGYDDTKTQVLAHESGCLKWVDTTECEEGSS